MLSEHHPSVYCPIARASEILAQRWTPIIVRDLLGGPTTFAPRLALVTSVLEGQGRG